MERRATPPAPARPACADCIRLENQETAAELEGDLSRAVDFRVMLRRHRAEAHAGEQ